MTNKQLKNKNPEAKPTLFAGIDVGAEELVLVIRKNGKSFDPQKFANTPADRARLVKNWSSCRVSLSVWRRPVSEIG